MRGHRFRSIAVHVPRRDVLGSADPALWSQLLGQDPPDPHLQDKRLRMLAYAKLCRERLSTYAFARVPLPGVPKPVLVTRAEHEQLIAEQIGDTVIEVETAIADAGTGVKDLAAIWAIGGVSATPLVAAALGRLGRPVVLIARPELVVVRGAAVWANRTFRTAQ